MSKTPICFQWFQMMTGMEKSELHQESWNTSTLIMFGNLIRALHAWCNKSKSSKRLEGSLNNGSVCYEWIASLSSDIQVPRDVNESPNSNYEYLGSAKIQGIG